MPIRNKLSRFLPERRQAPRQVVQLEVSLVVGIAIEGGSEVITGRTRDLSETGLSMSLPLNYRQREQAVKGTAARVLLVLPKKTVSMYAEIKHGQLLDEHDPGRGSLLGVLITDIDVEDKAIYLEYLSSIS